MANRTVGIDFGHGVIRGAEVDDPGTPRQQVLRTGSVPIAGDAVVSGEVRDQAAVAAALRQLWAKAGFKTKRVVLGMGNSRVLARDLQVPLRPLAMVREGLKFAVADMLPMPLENAVLDYYPISTGKDADGNDVFNGMLIAALKDVALAAPRAARSAGLEVVGLDMIPFALIRSLSEPSNPETWAYIDVGGTTTIISIATSGVPEFVRTVPVGGEDVTRSLMDLGQLTREQAEQIKRTVGLSADGVDTRYRPVVELMVTRSGELMTSLRDTIQYFTDTRQRQVARIVLTGGGARLAGFAQMVTAWARIPAYVVGAGDAEFIVATALASGARTRRGEAKARPAAAPRPAAPPPAAAPAPVVVPSAAASSPPVPTAPAAATPVAPEPVPAAKKKSSFWSMEIGGKRR